MLCHRALPCKLYLPLIANLLDNVQSTLKENTVADIWQKFMFKFFLNKNMDCTWKLMIEKWHTNRIHMKDFIWILLRIKFGRAASRSHLYGVILYIADVEVSMQRINDDEVHWKNQVIIVCTVTVAMEVLMIALIVMCWRQIRWTLLKLTCHCVRLFYSGTEHSTRNLKLLEWIVAPVNTSRPHDCVFLPDLIVCIKRCEHASLPYHLWLMQSGQKNLYLKSPFTNSFVSTPFQWIFCMQHISILCLNKISVTSPVSSDVPCTYSYWLYCGTACVWILTMTEILSCSLPDLPAILFDVGRCGCPHTLYAQKK